MSRILLTLHGLPEEPRSNSLEPELRTIAAKLGPFTWSYFLTRRTEC